MMTLQNRVTPFGTIIRTTARGTLMGNRGILHDTERNVVKRWAHQQWIHCVLSFKGRKRVPMSPGKYTELFFLDETTALAAGHRPCGECQREKYREFKALLEESCGKKLKSKDFDRLLHQERLMWMKGKRVKQKKTYATELGELPSHTMIVHDGVALRWLDGVLSRWTPEGYVSADLELTPDSIVDVLTPLPIVKVLNLDYQVG